MKIGDRFASRLHDSLFKLEGFKKKARTFSRIHPAYGEHYNIQGSTWNSSGSPWRFYVNCGISFPDVPLERAGTGMWAFHAHTRLRVFAPDSPPEFDLTSENFEQLVSDLGCYIRRCMTYFSRRHEFLRESYVQRKYHLSFLYDPELLSATKAVQATGHRRCDL